MKKSGVSIIIFFVIIIFGFWFWRQNVAHQSSTTKDPFRDTTHLIFTKHARCRMDCRNINKKEINEIILSGNVNYSKSGRGTKGDETYALEGYSYEHQHLRVVVAPERDGLVVITCIDLDKEWPCNCY
ncbi:MAG: DUF4258 domain-containing protein [Bacteroidota bacterium]|nr:DUF4258 domain-containing protein [Bacteroidota bacterium]